VAACLQLERHAPRPTANVEPADVAQGQPFVRRPSSDGREVVERGGVDEAIVALDDLVARPVPL